MFLIVAGGAFSVLLGKYAEVQQVYATYQHNAQSDREKAKDKIAESCSNAEGASLARCISNGLDAYANQQASNKDLQAQQNMAFWAACMFGVGILEVGATLVGIFLVWKTLDATKQELAIAKVSAEESTRIGKAQVRGYLSVDGGKFSLLERFIWFEINLTNRGQSPLFDGNCTARLVLTSAEEGPFSIELIGGYGALAAGQSGLCRLHVSNDRVGKERLENIANGRMRIFVNATFTWMDVFDDQALANYGLDQVGGVARKVVHPHPITYFGELSATCIGVSRVEDKEKT